MGYREHIEIFNDKPPYHVGDKYRVYIGKGFFVDGIITDIRLSNILNQWILKVNYNPKEKFTYD